MDQDTYDRLRQHFADPVPGEHLYKGLISCFDIFEEKDAREFETLKLDPNDIIVASVPRSGTTLTLQIVWLLMNNADFDKALQTPIWTRTHFIDQREPLQIFKSTPAPRIIKTHTPYNIFSQIWDPQDPKSPKIVVPARNPKDEAVSLYHFYRQCSQLGPYKGTWDSFYERWLEGYVVYNDWFDHVLGWYKAFCDDAQSKILFIKYEELITDLFDHIVKIQEFLGTEYSHNTLKEIEKFVAFDHMKSNPKANYEGFPFFNEQISPMCRKGIVGDWKTHFTVSQNERFMQKYYDKMRNQELTFRFE